MLSLTLQGISVMRTIEWERRGRRGRGREEGGREKGEGRRGGVNSFLINSCWVADQFTSATVALVDFEYTICHYFFYIGIFFFSLFFYVFSVRFLVCFLFRCLFCCFVVCCVLTKVCSECTILQHIREFKL